MRDVDPKQLAPDVMFFKGRIQISTALAALEMTDLNPDAQADLSRTLELDDRFSRGMSPRREVKLYKRGPSVVDAKVAIISSLMLMEHGETCTEQQREAAGSLLDVLGVEHPAPSG